MIKILMVLIMMIVMIPILNWTPTVEFLTF